MTSYLTSIDTFSLSRTVFEIFDFKILRVRPWLLTFRVHLRSYFFIPFESPYMTSYLTSKLLGFDPDLSLSRIPFLRYLTSNFLGFDLDLWPLEVIWGQNCFHTIRKPIHDFLSNFHWQFSLYLVPFLRYLTSNFLGFDLDLWPSKGHLRSKFVIPFESPYMTSYLTSIDTFSLSRTVFEIFDFKLLRVWPWPLTSKGHLGSKNFIRFESPYMTSYLTSMDTISLSRTVLEIMPVKVLKAAQNGGIWPFKGQGHQPIFSIIEKAPPLTKRRRLRYCASKSV